ncbi:MAG: hypothetical protein VB063_02620 [Bacteroides graminisolvens]|nr:hypothetical protein [Bacteroides graminisolvens]
MNTRKTATAILLLFVTIALSAQEAKYEMKSAIIKKKTEFSGQVLESTTFIDDYGKKEATEIIFKNGMSPGVDKSMMTIMDSTSVITVDMDTKVANRVNLPTKPINYLQISDEIRDQYKLKEAGEEAIGDKTCKIYTLEISQMGQTLQLKVWVWKGIALKSETSAGGTLLATETTTDIQENAAVLQDKFSLPAGVTIQ